jgi:hypothetical protein
MGSDPPLLSASSCTECSYSSAACIQFAAQGNVVLSGMLLKIKGFVGETPTKAESTLMQAEKSGRK